MLCCRQRKQISKLIDDLGNNGFKLKFNNNLTDYLSCRVIQKEEIGDIPICNMRTSNKKGSIVNEVLDPQPQDSLPLEILKETKEVSLLRLIK